MAEKLRIVEESPAQRDRQRSRAPARYPLLPTSGGASHARKIRLRVNHRASFAAIDSPRSPTVAKNDLYSLAGARDSGEYHANQTDLPSSALVQRAMGPPA